MGTNAVKKPARPNNDEIVIPEKLYFRIGEVARLCKLPTYVLRFWETEFPQLKPGKSDTGQRMYRRRDLDNVLRIKQLLYDEGYTIAGARQQLRTEMKSKALSAPLPFPAMAKPANLNRVKQGLQEILAILSPTRQQQPPRPSRRRDS
ncbi:MAG TPA: MerR family transcriptional regulator [Terriglobales bacterium]|nr:MerR family transcriptional regulator [Terriglobales bacterium]